jgi:beta-N-acetylhexosaminidase
MKRHRKTARWRDPVEHGRTLLCAVTLLLLAGSSVGHPPQADAAYASAREGPAGRAVEAVDEPVERVTDPEAAAWIESTLSQLTLRQRVAQLVFPWIRGGSIPRNTAEYRRIRGWLEEEQVGGLIVSRGPVGDFAPMMNELQAMSRLPLLIVSDLETGPGMRLTGGTSLPPAMAFGAAASTELAYEAGRLTGLEARNAGIHMTLGPVLDVNSNPLNPIINTRSFGEDPEEVARLANAWIRGARDAGLLAAGKHFPGHGATEVDSHVGLPTLTASPAELAALDLVPFRRAFGAGMDGVLVGHIAVPALDGRGAPPASVSPRVISGLLRGELGFDGLVFTDALNMGAITRNYTVAEASIQALLAGADVLLQPPGERGVIDAIVAAVESGRLPAARVDEAARRVLRAKAAAGLHLGPSVRAPGGRTPPEHAGVVRRLAAASITLARDRQALVPLAPTVRNILHVAFAADGTNFNGGALNAELRAAGRVVDAQGVGARTPPATYRALTERARRADLVLVSANLIPREYRPLALDGDYAAFVRDLVARGVPVVVVSFGSPYLLDFFPGVSSYLLAWSSGAESQRAAARVLIGREPAGGRLPVSIPPHHGVGERVAR